LLDLSTYFAMARGRSSESASALDVPALEMTKWFDTNYHYLVPEFEPGQVFELVSTKPIDEFIEAQELALHTRPVLVGPVTSSRCNTVLQYLAAFTKDARPRTARTVGRSRRGPKETRF
jgi:hypothetical protein